VNKIKNNFKKTLIAFLLIAGISQIAMAVDGIIVKSRSSKSSFSNLKKNLTLSLHSGFSYHDNKSFGFIKNERHNSFKTVISYQKGNIKYNIPYKNKVILQKFKTPQRQ
jgi:hypothetical protein